MKRPENLNGPPQHRAYSYRSLWQVLGKANSATSAASYRGSRLLKNIPRRA